jgi:hypothetical protein
VTGNTWQLPHFWLVGGGGICPIHVTGNTWQLPHFCAHTWSHVWRDNNIKLI